MDEALKAISNYGFPIVMCLLMYFGLVKKTDKLNRLIENDLVHVIEEDSKNTKEVKTSIDKLTIEIAKMNGKK